MERLQKILSAAGVASRRTAETLIAQGRVSVNGRTIVTLGTKADPSVDEIKVDGRRIRPAGRLRYILVYKPRGFVSTRSDPQKRKTVLDLIPHVREYVYPVGRLDYDSEGLLLLTNDGELTAQLTHPSHGIDRVYLAQVAGIPDARALDRLARGVVLDGVRTGPAVARLVGESQRRGTQRQSGDREPTSMVELILREGRNRQVRRMCEAVGHPVVRLTRVRLGPLTLRGLRAGHSRELTPAEVTGLRHAAGRSGKKAAGPSDKKKDVR